MRNEPISRKPPLTSGARIGCGLLGLFLVGISLTGFWFMCIVPWMKVIQARSWATSDCTILSSSIKTHDGDDGDTYSPDISFEYEIDNRKYVSDTYAFFTWSGPHSVAKKVVDEYPKGSQTTCYFAPGDHGTAVLYRKFQWASLFGLLILIFTAAGAACLYIAISKERSSGNLRAKGGKSRLSTDPTSGTWQRDQSDQYGELFSEQWNGPQRLKPEGTRLGRVIGAAAFCGIWNGFLGVFIYAMGEPAGWFFYLFIIPFALIGILLVAATVHSLLAMANPVVEIALSSGSVRPGETLDVAWETVGRHQKISDLKIEIVGEEQAKYRRGTDTITDTEVFFTEKLADTSDSSEIQFGSASVSIPLNALHSFDALNNKIVWTFKIAGNIRWWPDVKEEFAFRVKP